MKLNVLEEFRFYHDGVTPTVYPVGVQDVPDDAAAVALAQKWAEEESEPATLSVNQVVKVVLNEGADPVEVKVTEYAGGKTFKCENAAGETKQYRTAQIVASEE